MDSYKALLEKINEIELELEETGVQIRRLTNRYPAQFVAGSGTVKNKNEVHASGSQFPNKKRLASVCRLPEGVEGPIPLNLDRFDEESTLPKRPKLQSTIMASPKDVVKSRKDSIQEQNINSNVTARNRRMFGMMLGTLQKFQLDEKERKEQDLKKAEIQQKVEAAAEHEREQIKKQKKELFIVRTEKENQLRCLEKKLEITEMHKAWRSSQKKLLNFIQTKSTPSIFFLPAIHNDKSLKCLEESKKKITERIRARDEEVEKELKAIEELYKNYSLQSDKNIGTSVGNQDVLELSANEPIDQSADQLEILSVPQVLQDIANGNGENMMIDPLTDQDFEPIYDE